MTTCKDYFLPSFALLSGAAAAAAAGSPSTLALSLSSAGTGAPFSYFTS